MVRQIAFDGVWGMFVQFNRWLRSHDFPRPQQSLFSSTTAPRSPQQRGPPALANADLVLPQETTATVSVPHQTTAPFEQSSLPKPSAAPLRSLEHLLAIEGDVPLDMLEQLEELREIDREVWGQSQALEDLL